MTNNNRDHLDAGNGYAAQLETLRSAVKWLLAAAAGVGALLVGGLQLTGIGRLPMDSWRFYVAVCAVGITLLSIGYMIRAASTVLTQEWLTLADFTDDVSGLPGPMDKGTRRPSAHLGAIETHLMQSRHELFAHSAPTLAELHRKLRDSHEELQRSDLDGAARLQLADRSSELRKSARDVVQAANYYYVLRLFKGLRTRMGWAALIGIAGVAVFAYVVHPPS